jgi:hypothetical protein
VRITTSGASTYGELRYSEAQYVHELLHQHAELRVQSERQEVIQDLICSERSIAERCKELSPLRRVLNELHIHIQLRGDGPVELIALTYCTQRRY